MLSQFHLYFRTFRLLCYFARDVTIIFLLPITQVVGWVFQGIDKEDINWLEPLRTFGPFLALADLVIVRTSAWAEVTARREVPIMCKDDSSFLLQSRSIFFWCLAVFEGPTGQQKLRLDFNLAEKSLNRTLLKFGFTYDGRFSMKRYTTGNG